MMFLINGFKYVQISWENISGRSVYHFEKWHKGEMWLSSQMLNKNDLYSIVNKDDGSGGIVDWMGWYSRSWYIYLYYVR